MNAADFTTCAFCPRLCRHVCPVAVATAREAAVPSAMMTAAWLALEGRLDRPDALLATRYCLGCGACTDHCKHHVPVAERLAAFREAPPPAPRAAAAPPAVPPASAEGLAFLPCSAGPVSSPDQLACCGRRDGFPDREPELAEAVARENVRRFAGRAVRCADPDCAAWLARHGARLAPGEPA